MDEKLSTKMIKYDYDRKIDREEYEANLVREVENLEEQLEMQNLKLNNFEKVLQEGEKLKKELQLLLKMEKTLILENLLILCLKIFL